MVARGHRTAALALAVLVGAVATLFGAPAAARPGDPAGARPGVPVGSPRPVAGAPGDLCSVEEWQADFRACAEKLSDVGTARAQCLVAPTPSAPDSGLAGWFAARPESATEPGPKGIYSRYGYAGYSYTTYDLGCLSTLAHPDYKDRKSVV